MTASPPAAGGRGWLPLRQGWLPLYLRSRRVPLAVAVSVGAVAVVSATWAGVTDQSRVHQSLAALTVALAAAPIIPTLAGDDAALEQTAALRWPPRRALHLLTGAAVVAGILVAARLGGTDFGPAGLVARNTAGLVGLLGLGTALAGTSWSWQAPFSWVAAQCFVPLPDGPVWRQALLWMVQPPENRTAAVTAGALLLAGLLGYAARVGPPTSAAETAMAQ
ncbi:hypothetical protein O7626_23570 [Micromonospora sp. WMMD1102]|uniref:hypothetical protein n=1 Tax=Micromonospora sp. WMMD1102 TaxID=3016105 RepID=UPI00241531D7|nr:hypothetical protein [Micromonospora sp. WMMD1102]MDG4788868.1 hypothetical protein [Micromonospora sp. WMMD1102]